MIDYFAIGLTHALLVLVALRLVMRGDLDRDGEADGANGTTPVRADKGRRRA
jgi:hypothetical protein